MGCCSPVGASPRAPVPPDARRASRSGVPATCQPSHGRTKRAGARREAAGWSPARGRGVASRRAAAVSRHTPPGCQRRQAAVLGAGWPGRRTPPGSESGACLHRGSAGTWEPPRSPCPPPGVGAWAPTGPGVAGALHPGHAPDEAPPNAVQQGREREASAQRRDPRGAGGRLRGAASRCRWGPAPPGPHGRPGGACPPVSREGPRGETPGAPTVSRRRQSQAHQAHRAPERVGHTVLPLLAPAVLRAAARLPRQQRAPGSDQGTATPEAEPGDAHRRARPARLRAKREGAPPGARGWSETDAGPQRPRGPPGGAATRGPRVVALRLAASVAPAVPAVSPGGRTGHRPQPARQARREPGRPGPSTGSGEAEVRGGGAPWAWRPRRALLPPRVRAGGRRRRLGTWRHAGGREAGALRHPDKGTPPGGGSAPLRAKVCLPHVLDAGVGKDGHPRRQGRGLLRRWAADGLIGGACAAEARRRMAVLPPRCPRCRRTMPPEQTALRACQRPPSRPPSAGSPGTGAWRGWPHEWGQTRQGYGGLTRQPVGKRLRRLRPERGPGCRAHRHAPRPAPSRPCGAPRRGDDQDDGLRGHVKRLAVVCEPTERAGHAWRSPRSHQGPRHGQPCAGVLRQPLPRPLPRLRHNISQGQGQHRDAPTGVAPVW
jgi:hypothetical protein